MNEVVGYVLAQWDYATICVWVRGRGDNGPDAKAQTLEPSQQVHAVLESFGISAQEKKVTFTLKEETKYDRGSDEHHIVGYRATNHITSYVGDLAKVGELQDALTSIPGVEVAAPVLRLSPQNKEKYQAQALTRAWEKMQRRWEHECKVLERDPNEWYVGNFNVHYDRGNRNEVGAEVATANEALQFNAGAALVSVSLSCNYYRRGNHKPSSGPYTADNPCFCTHCGTFANSASAAGKFPSWEEPCGGR